MVCQSQINGCRPLPPRAAGEAGWAARKRTPRLLLRPLPPRAAGEAVWAARKRTPRLLLRPLPPRAAGEAVWAARKRTPRLLLRPLPPRAAGEAVWQAIRCSTQPRRKEQGRVTTVTRPRSSSDAERGSAVSQRGIAPS